MDVVFLGKVKVDMKMEGAVDFSLGWQFSFQLDNETDHIQAEL